MSCSVCRFTNANTASVPTDEWCCSISVGCPWYQNVTPELFLSFVFFVTAADN